MLKVLALALIFAVVSAELAPLLHTDNEKVIPGSYIVILKETVGVLERDAHIAALENRIREVQAEESDVNFRYAIDTFIGFSARLNKQMLQEQLAHPNVKYIEADQIMSIAYPNFKDEVKAEAPAAITQTGATWGICRVSRRDLPFGTTYTYPDTAGAGTYVYVIDTGILTTHNDFGGRATAVYNAITNEANNDLNGHGTHCAGTIGGTTYGVAKRTNLRAVKVLNAQGSGTNAGVVAGINYVANNAPARSVASMSLGGGASTATDDAVRGGVSRGVTFSIAAGNDNANACNYSPARTGGGSGVAITVGATTNTDARSSFSNFGTCVDIFAPGSSITSDWIGSNTATNTISGTSMACPHVSGAAALYLGAQAATPAAVKAALKANATPNKVGNPGTGSPNSLLFTNP